MGERYFWIAVSEIAAVAWKEVTDESGKSLAKSAGFISWGPVTSEALSLNISTLSSHRSGFPTWEGISPPGAEEIARSWKKSARARQRSAAVTRSNAQFVDLPAGVTLYSGGPGKPVFSIPLREFLQRVHSVAPNWELPEPANNFSEDSIVTIPRSLARVPRSVDKVLVVDAFESRRKDESVSDFYERVADFYREMLPITGAPTEILFKAAGLDKKPTAAGWVHEARKRGKLPPTTQGSLK